MEDEEEGISQFTCRTESVKSLADWLVCLSLDIGKDQEAIVEITNEALIFGISGRGKSSQGRLTLPAGLFSHFEFRSTEAHCGFILKLPILIDCLRLFGPSGDSTAAVLSYDSNDALFRLTLEDAGMNSLCELATVDYDPSEELEYNLLRAFRRSRELCQIVIRSEPLREALQELAESLWAESVKFEIKEAPPLLKFTTGGSIGSGEILIPRNSDAYVSFNCTAPFAFLFPIRSLLLGFKALNVAKESYLRVNEDGILCVQHQIETSNGPDAYFDFLLLPIEETIEEVDTTVDDSVFATR